MHYTVKAYLCTNFAGLMDSLETDYWGEIEDFIWDNVQKGYNCEFTDNERGETHWVYADNFDEETVSPEDLTINTDFLNNNPKEEFENENSN
jgi:hypothetical protein